MAENSFDVDIQKISGTKNLFYTYLFLDTRKPGVYKYKNYSFRYEPIYVGKGHGSRWKDHLNYYGDWLGHKIKKMKNLNLSPEVIFQGKNQDEQSAFDLEIELIGTIGRIDLETGPLVNMTEGGEGAVGRIVSAETKRKLSDSKKGDKHPMYGKKFLKEHKKKLSEAQKERYKRDGHPSYGPPSEETKKKISDSNKGKNKGKIMSDEIKVKLSNSCKGKIPWSKGKTFSIEYRKKLSESHKGILHTKEWKKKMSERMKGENNPMYKRYISEESRKKMSDSHKGKIPWNKGKVRVHFEEIRKNMSKSNKK